MIREVRAALGFGERGLDLRSHLQEPAIRTVDRCAVVREKLRAHIEPGEAVLAGEQPVSAAAQHLAVKALAFEAATDHLEE